MEMDMISATNVGGGAVNFRQSQKVSVKNVFCFIYE